MSNMSDVVKPDPSFYALFSEQIEAGVNAKIAELVDGAPDLLDKLSEISAAIGNDPNFITTILSDLAGKENVGVSLKLPVSVARVFVDATNGSDSNNGLGPGDAKQTLAAAKTLLGADGGTILATGTFNETLSLPLYPKVVNVLPLGSVENFVIRAPAINTPAIQCAGGGTAQLGTIECTVQPHASGTTGGLVLMDGMRQMTLRISYKDNGSGGCDRIFDARSITACYRNTIIPTCISQSHASRVVFCGNGGGVGTNPNINKILEPFIYANANMVSVFDLGDSTDWTIDGGLVEANTNAIAVIFGNATKIRGSWFESNAATDFVMSLIRSISPQNCSVENTYHSGSALVIPAGIYGFVASYAGTFTITDTDGWKRNRIETAGDGRGMSPWTSKVPIHCQVLLQIAATGQVATVGTWGAPQQGTNMLMRANTSAANGDSITFGIQLPKGTYSFDLVHNKGSDSPIVAIWIDGVDTGKTIDMYAASPSVGLGSATAVAIEDGYHTVELRATGKNASSSSYLMRLGSMIFTRTA